MSKSVVLVSALVLGITANVGVWLAARNPAAAKRDALWSAMETVKVPDRPDLPPAFPDELRSREGQRISLTGVAFVTKEGLDSGRVRWCVLMPPSRYGCCGVSCDPRPELSVYVDCSAAPWTVGETHQVMATVEGTLRLQRDGASWCLYTLEDAAVRPVSP